MKKIWYHFVYEMGFLATDLAIWMQKKSRVMFELGGSLELWADERLNGPDNCRERFTPKA